MTVSPADYRWLSATSFEDVGYCVVLAQQLSPHQVLDRLGATHRGDCTGLTELDRHNDQVQQRVGHEWGEFQLVGVASVPGVEEPWAVMVEFGGMVGLDHALMKQLTAGIWAVSHHKLGGKGRFCSWRDGNTITEFEWPYHQRWGQEPDALNQAIAAVGVDCQDQDTMHGYFALAEHLTGVRLSAELMEHLAFITGIVALSDQARAHGWHWTDPDPMSAESIARDRRIRAWAAARGLKVPPGDQIPQTVVELYDACHDAQPLWFQRPLPEHHS
ncbi:DUF6461 domain-containing protein [Actinomadura kijaniata]|uniref:DUF6461 domain-containing protein n=1 Tax=Actinomadura kijaniata TaxID=46161 RepID=UPI003F196485